MSMYIQNKDIVIEWNKDKNELLKAVRGVCFEQVEKVIKANNIITIQPHPNQKKYPNQKIMYLEINQYIYAVPFIDSATRIFLKTIYPSRKAMKKYRMKGQII